MYVCQYICLCSPRNLLDTDDYTPVSVQNSEEFEGVLDMYPYDDIEMKQAAYPKTFPFSAMVYQIFNQVNGGRGGGGGKV